MGFAIDQYVVRIVHFQFSAIGNMCRCSLHPYNFNRRDWEYPRTGRAWRSKPIKTLRMFKEFKCLENNTHTDSRRNIQPISHHHPSRHHRAQILHPLPARSSSNSACCPDRLCDPRLATRSCIFFKPQTTPRYRVRRQRRRRHVVCATSQETVQLPRHRDMFRQERRVCAGAGCGRSCGL